MVPVSIAQLVQGEIRTMIFTKLTAIAAGVATTGFVATGLGLVVACGWPGPLVKGPAAPAQVRNGGPGSLVPGPGAPGQPGGDDSEARAASVRNLMTLGLAMINFANDRNQLPAAAIRKDGKPLLSWRVALLPFLEEQALYDKFHLDEPWDSPHNKPLLDQMPAIYAPVTLKNDGSKQTTYYQVFVGPGALFEGDKGLKRKEIKDGANLTILVVEAARPVPWTKPEDLSFDKEKPLPELGGLFKAGFNAVFADGSAHFLGRNTEPEVLRALITPNGGEPVDSEKF
jgi:hypothetical protein